VEELLKSYQVPRKVGKRWVENGQILPLLDGLDEVAASARDLCIDAINTYRRDHLVPLVICSRTNEYFSQEHHLVLQNAVVVQPLTTEQIDDYLKMAGSQLVALQTALQNNQVLRELAVSPLMLNILTLTYRDVSPSDLPEFLDEAARHILLRKVGGGYVFIHRLFLDYIASLDGQQEQA
jgi:predicted NACHT family NTPase